jgi:hypothetical protein
MPESLAAGAVVTDQGRVCSIGNFGNRLDVLQTNHRERERDLCSEAGRRFQANTSPAFQT